MGSLQDELRRAGLVAKSGKSRHRRQRPKQMRQGGEGDIDLASAYRAREREEAAEQTRQRQEEAARRKANARLRKLVASLRPDDQPADVERYFEHHGKIRKLYVTGGQQEALNRGAAGIVQVRGRYYVVPAEVVAQVRALKAEAVVLDQT